ncbi:MAG: hypothetical protein ACI8Z1_000688 [Candidatus Azotimanducaceae bacterium]|jgi:hypothetical protein
MARKVGLGLIAIDLWVNKRWTSLILNTLGLAVAQVLRNKWATRAENRVRWINLFMEQTHYASN